MLVRRTLKWFRATKRISDRLSLVLTLTSALIPGCALAASAGNGQAASPPPQLPRAGLQRPGRQAPRVSSIDKRVAKLGTQLNLNDVQRFDLKRLLESQQAEANRLWNNQDINPIERMTKLRNLQEGTQKRFSALLTDEQRKKYEERRQKAAQPAPQPQASEKHLH
jgi:hypothetical protein